MNGCLLAVACSLFCAGILLILYWYGHQWCVEIDGTTFYFETREEAEYFIVMNRLLMEGLIELQEEINEVKRNMTENGAG